MSTLRLWFIFLGVLIGLEVYGGTHDGTLSQEWWRFAAAHPALAWLPAAVATVVVLHLTFRWWKGWRSWRPKR